MTGPVRMRTKPFRCDRRRKVQKCPCQDNLNRLLFNL